MPKRLMSPPLDRDSFALAAFELSAHGDELFVTGGSASCHFDRTDYSEFKYGRRDLARRYGALLGSALQPHLMSLSSGNEPIVVLGTPYKRLPNAARMLAVSTEHHLRIAGFTTSYTSIYQHRLAEGDYGRLSASERDKRNRLKKRFIDADDFAGHHTVVVDDVRITGSIERSITDQFKEIPVLSLTFINLVRLDEQVALANPMLEDQLNHYAVNSLYDIVRLMHAPHGFMLIARVLKYILDAAPHELAAFLELLSSQEVADLYESAVDEGYNMMPRYRDAFSVLRTAYETQVSALLLSS